jgi:hypothetical protein
MRLKMAQKIDKTNKDSGLVRFLFVFIFLLFNARLIFPQWVSTNGPGGGEITAFTACGNNLLSGTFTEGPFLSTNNGLTWKLVDFGIPANTGVSALTVIGNNIFAGIEDPASTSLGIGVFLSTNNGSTWTQVNNGLTSTYIHAFAVSGNNVFAGTDPDNGGGGGVFLSTNNGSSWTQVNNGLPSNITVYALAVSGNNIFAGTNGGGPNGPQGIYLSTDNGANWVLSNNGLQYKKITKTSKSHINRFIGTKSLVKNVSGKASLNKELLLPMRPTVYALAANNNNIFAGTTEGVYISNDNGADWSLITDGLIYGEYVYSIISSGENTFAGTSGGVYLSTNNGILWTEVIKGLPSNVSVNALFFLGNNILAGTGGGIYLSSDKGANWSDANQGLIGTKINTLAVSGNYIFAGTYNSYGVEGVYLSSDHGNSWSLSNNGIPTGISFNALVVNGNNIYAGGDNGFYLSTNSGISWSQSGLTGTIVNSLAVSGNNVFAGTIDGVYLSTDNGSAWAVLNNGLPAGISYNAVAVSGNDIFVGGENGIYFSSDNGSNWIQTINGLPAYPDNYFISLAVEGNNIFGGTFGGGVYLSTNNGSTWAAANNGLTGTIVRSIAVSGYNIFAGTSDGGVYLSTNFGSVWAQANNGFSNSDIRSLAVNDNNIFVGTYGGGVWLRQMYELLPVELNGFSAVVNHNSVQLKWKTSTEVNNHGFEVERAFQNNSLMPDQWESLAFIEGSGNSNSNKEYSFTDASIKGNGKYYYRLKQVDNNAGYKFSNAVEVSINFINQVYSLENNFPNPYNPNTLIRYSLPFDSNVKLTVYNSLGQTVKELISEVQKSGMHEVNFDGSNLASGTYFYTMRTASADGSQNFVSSKKMILLK